jgi:hypothetical protein
MKLCRDCRRVFVAPTGERLCMHPVTAKWFVDYFDGKENFVQPTIEIARTIGECGREAALFEAASP